MRPRASARRGGSLTERTERIQTLAMGLRTTARGDGRRILVERLWPRGMKKEALALDAWVKERGPGSSRRRAGQ